MAKAMILIMIILFSLLIFNGLKDSYSDLNKIYKKLDIKKSDVRSAYKFLFIDASNTNKNIHCTLIIHVDFLLIVLPTINYKILKENILGASIFNTYETKKNSESLGEHLLGTAIYSVETEAILDALRPATKTVKSKKDFMAINFISSSGITKSIFFAPEILTGNSFINQAVKLINRLYLTKPEIIPEEGISSETMEL